MPLAILHSHPSKIFSRQQPFFLPRTAASAQGASLSMASPPLPRASSSVRGGQQPRRSASLPCCRSPYRDGEQPCAPCRQAEPPAERAPCPSPGRVPCSTASRKPAPLCNSFSHGARRPCSKAPSSSSSAQRPPLLHGVQSREQFPWPSSLGARRRSCSPLGRQQPPHGRCPCCRRAAAPSHGVSSREH